MIKLKPLALSLASMLFAGAAFGVTNGDFSNGLTGWTAFGDFGVASGAATGGNASPIYDDEGTGAIGAFNLHGGAPLEVGVPGGLDDVAGLPLGALDPDAENGIFGYEGSALLQSFTVSAGDQLSFDWNLFSNDSLNPDYAFVAINGVLIPLGNSLSALTASSVFAFETGLQTFNYTFTDDATATLAIGVVDVGDFGVSSAMRVDNVTITPVPEPSAAFLAFAGAAAVGFIRRRRSC